MHDIRNFQFEQTFYFPFRRQFVCQTIALKYAIDGFPELALSDFFVELQMIVIEIRVRISPLWFPDRMPAEFDHVHDDKQRRRIMLEENHFSFSHVGYFTRHGTPK